jgi:pyruvate carboxylase
VLKLDEQHDVAFPNSVVEMFSGVLGVPPDGWPRKVQRILLRGAKPVRGRPGASMQAIDFPAEKETLEKKTGHTISGEDLLSYLLYPEVFLKFDKFRQAHSDVSSVRRRRLSLRIEVGRRNYRGNRSRQNADHQIYDHQRSAPRRTRTLFFELNGQPREVTVRDKALRVVERAHPKADPAEVGQVGATTAGVITGIAVQVNQNIERGAKLMTLEAMKMQSNIYAPISGRVTKLLVAPGQSVEAKDLLVTIAP